MAQQCFHVVKEVLYSTMPIPCMKEVLGWIPSKTSNVHNNKNLWGPLGTFLINAVYFQKR